MLVNVVSVAEPFNFYAKKAKKASAIIKPGNL